MSFSQRFNTAYVRLSSAQNEDLFLSVTPGFERGPGIRRDGLTEPRMKDPHSIEYILGSASHTMAKTRQLAWRDLPPSTDPFVQRAGTWTIVKGGMKLGHCGGEKLDHSIGSWGFRLIDLRRRLERRPATPDRAARLGRSGSRLGKAAPQSRPEIKSAAFPTAAACCP